jgi:hypothetical protein
MGSIQLARFHGAMESHEPAMEPKLVKHPVLGRIHALQVLDDSARHDLAGFSESMRNPNTE